MVTCKNTIFQKDLNSLNIYFYYQDKQKHIK